MDRRLPLGWLVAAGLCAVLTAAMAAGARAQAPERAPTIKIGFDRVFLSGAGYTLEQTATKTKYANTDQMIGNIVYGEYVFFERLGVIAEYALVPFSRAYQLKDTSANVIADIKESATLAMVGANLYFNRSTGRGLKYFFGLSTGTVTAAQAYGDTSAGSLASASTSLSVPVNALRVGMDWMMGNAGIRLQYQSLSGSTDDTQGLSGYRQTAAYTAAELGIGVFAFF